MLVSCSEGGCPFFPLKNQCNALLLVRADSLIYFKVYDEPELYCGSNNIISNSFVYFVLYPVMDDPGGGHSVGSR